MPGCLDGFCAAEDKRSIPARPRKGAKLKAEWIAFSGPTIIDHVLQSLRLFGDAVVKSLYCSGYTEGAIVFSTTREK